jgi:single-strand DNA-binding protein
MINKVVIVGNLVRDPEFSKTPTGLSLARFTVAVNRRFSQNKDEADFIRVIAWRQTADFIGQYGKKGSTVGVEGKITTGSYDDKTTGKKVYTTEVTADNVQLIGSRNQNDSTQAQAPQREQNYFADEPVTPSSSDDDFDTGPLLDISSDDLPF